MSTGSAALRLPAQRAFVGVARLCLAGIAGRLGFDVDAAEDIKLAVAEAVNLLLAGGDGAPDDSIDIASRWADGRFEIEVTRSGAAPTGGDPSERAVAVMVMEAVVDEVECVDLDGDRPTVRLRCHRPAG